MNATSLGPQKLLWLDTGFIGDVVLLTAGIDAAQKKWPRVSQYVISNRAGAQILNVQKSLKGIIEIDKSKGNFVSQYIHLKRTLYEMGLLAEKKDVILLQVHRSARSALLGMLLPFRRVAFRESFASFFAWKRVPRISLFHETKRICLLLEPLGMNRSESISGSRPQLSLCDDFNASKLAKIIADFKGANHLVGVAPGSVWGTKRWPVEHFIKTIQLVHLVNKECKFILIGSANEKALCDQIESAWQAHSQEFGESILLNFAGKTSLKELMGLISTMDLLLANDSSPIHFASAMNIQTLGIFGSTVPEMGFAPLAQASRTIGIELDCRPCSDHGPQSCPLGHFRCMRELRPARVADELLSMVSG